MEQLRVFVFSPAFGLPTAGPFALKLEMWLRTVGIDYERVYEDNTRKGPKGKNPWVEIDGELMGDTKLIIERLARENDIDLHKGLDARQVALGRSIARMVEEHLHQILEYELFVDENGWAYMDETFSDVLPWGVGGLIKVMLRRHMRKHLYERGVARHTPDIIAQMGREDLDAVEELLPASGYLFGPSATVYDASIFGLCAPLVYSPIEAPTNQYAKNLPKLGGFCDRALGTWFDEHSAVDMAA